MTFKTAAKNFGNGLLTATTVVANLGTQIRINEIDTEIAELETKIAELKEERASLKASQF